MLFRFFSCKFADKIWFKFYFLVQNSCPWSSHTYGELKKKWFMSTLCEQAHKIKSIKNTSLGCKLWATLINFIKLQRKGISGCQNTNQHHQQAFTWQSPTLCHSVSWIGRIIETYKKIFFFSLNIRRLHVILDVPFFG